MALKVLLSYFTLKFSVNITTDSILYHGSIYIYIDISPADRYSMPLYSILVQKSRALVILKFSGFF